MPLFKIIIIMGFKQSVASIIYYFELPYLFNKKFSE